MSVFGRKPARFGTGFHPQVAGSATRGAVLSRAPAANANNQHTLRGHWRPTANATDPLRALRASSPAAQVESRCNSALENTADLLAVELRRYGTCPDRTQSLDSLLTRRELKGE